MHFDLHCIAVKNYFKSASENNCEGLFTLFDRFHPQKSRDYREIWSHRQGLLENLQKYHSTFFLEHIILFSKADGNRPSAKSHLMSWVLLLTFPQWCWIWVQPAYTIREGSHTLCASPQQENTTSHKQKQQPEQVGNNSPCTVMHRVRCPKP